MVNPFCRCSQAFSPTCNTECSEKTQKIGRNVSAKSKNVVIYATSNRRHLVKEKFSDREGDDVHFNDTVQEIISLSDRFGIHITFNKPNKETYLDIVRSLTNKKGIKWDTDELERKAEQFALKKGSRSARAAKQFVENMI